jgi:uncharacterized protein YoxC
MIGLGIVVLIIAIAWIIFPFMVVARCNKMIALLRAASTNIELQHYDARKLSGELPVQLAQLADILRKTKTAHEETNKALQWIVDNWGERPS